MRWLVALDLFFTTTCFDTVFRLLACGVETVFATGFEETENGEVTPISPSNHAQVLA